MKNFEYKVAIFQHRQLFTKLNVRLKKPKNENDLKF